MDTGMGAGAYSVIELKMIDEILSENTDDGGVCSRKPPASRNTRCGGAKRSEDWPRPGTTSSGFGTLRTK